MVHLDLYFPGLDDYPGFHSQVVSIYPRFSAHHHSDPQKKILISQHYVDLVLSHFQEMALIFPHFSDLFHSHFQEMAVISPTFFLSG
eukprot:UN27169